MLNVEKDFFKFWCKQSEVVSKILTKDQDFKILCPHL